MSKMKELNRLIHDMEETAKYYLRLVDEFKNSYLMIMKQFLNQYHQNLNQKGNSTGGCPCSPCYKGKRWL